MKQPNVILALGPDSTEKTRWPCHKDILQTSSVYFQAIFSSQFQETDASIVFLPRGIFSSEVLDDVIHYLYHNAIKTDHQKSDMERLEQLEAIYCAADYLSIEDLCNAAVKQISELAHGLTCSCHGCISFIPQLVLFTGPRYDDPRLTKMTDSILKLYTNDPEKALASLWVSPNSNILFSDLTVHQYLEDEILLHISKNNAIETLHGCFLTDQVQNQGRPLQVDSTIIKIREKSAQLVADHFDFYCTKYPKLLSCVDGITYSFEFLEYLLQSVTRDKIKVTNACSLYKGVVRSLMSRVAVQTRTQQLLKTTKNRIINYIATHLEEIKAVKPIDKTIIESLAQELLVPLNTLEDTKRKTSENRPVPEIRKRPQEPAWNIKVKSRFYTLVFGQAALNFKVGQRVRLLNRPVSTLGTVRYVGKVSSEKPFCLGVELDRSVGTSDGTLEGKRYFKTSTNRGIFVQPGEVTLA